MTAAKADPSTLSTAELMRMVRKNPWLLAVLLLCGGSGVAGVASRFGLATKADVEGLATKADMQEFKEEIKGEMVAMNETLAELAVEAGVNKRLREMHSTAMATNASRQP